MSTGIPPHPIKHPPPKIIHNHGPVGDVVRVEYSLPGLRRATVSVPYQRWREGGHSGVGDALAATLAELDLQHKRRADRLPDT
jgi:hypothetical protein